MRRLLLAPIVHTRADLGRLAGQVDPAALRAGDAFWATLTRAVITSGLPWAQVDVFQDALPVCGFETRLVQELARQGSANHRLLQVLSARGATLHGTEDPELLQREVALHTEGAPADALREVLEARDRAIAARIDEVLEPERVGLLFLGAAHDIAPWLSDDIRVERPFGSPST